MSLIGDDIGLLEGSDDEAVRHNRSIEQRAIQELKPIAESVAGSSAEIEPIPFAIPATYEPDDDGVERRLVCGFAAYSWVVDTATWFWSDEPAPFPHGEILGLLLGYSPAAIQAFLNQYRPED